jgi:hypothetical protein
MAFSQKLLHIWWKISLGGFCLWPGILFFSDNAMATADIQWTTDHLRRQVFAYAQVCQQQGVPQAPLIMQEGPFLNCMGQKISLRQFCQQQNIKNFMRAWADDQRREVVCERGTRGILELSCQKADCHHPQEQCRRLQKIFAADLELIHSGVWAGEALATPLPSTDFSAGPPEAVLSIFAFSQLKLECIYEAPASGRSAHEMVAETAANLTL